MISTTSLLGDVVTWTWIQPDEDSDGYTTTMPRFSAGEVVLWYGYDTDNQYDLAVCGSGGTLSGASAVVAGAAVAFGAAALAL